MRRFLIRLAFLNVLQKRLRAFLTIGGIALSTCIMVLLFGFGMGLQHMVTEQISKSELQNVVTVSSKNVKDIKLNSEAVAKIQSISGVTNVEQVINLSGQVTYNDIPLVIPVYGVTDGYFDLSPANVTAGKVEGQMDGRKRSVILSEGALKAFNLDHSIVGKKVGLTVTITQDSDTSQKETSRQVTARDFTVVGIVDKGTTPVGYIPGDYLFKNKVDNASQLKVELADGEKINPIRESIEQLGYQTTSIQDAINQVNRIFGVIRSILVAFGIVTILVTVFGTINTITIELVEATKQIGFLRIFGIRKSDVGMLFIMQSVILSTAGVLFGVLSGLMLGFFTTGFIQAVSEDATSGAQTGGYVYQIPFLPIIIMLVLSVTLGWVIGLLPARRAVTINPLDAIKS